ncbi:hydrolase [Neobacillus sp. PS3-40]|uniref:hydrolase n=1 Tax=Neobacillus sp. PS3-40 TaxID=3070679 RepID=UPI0027DF7BC5|nr:hydrolase [Neobacillus sp. PS3-40]WML43367.1 hydrolase [Neobacillus sp. PS3-40]
MENRNFRLGTEWNIIHYPEKPTGFGILIIGDERHFVDESKSFWLQNESKLSIIKMLKESGYTIFSSNLYGKNWGSEKAVELAQSLYQHMIRSEIINGKIHIIAEGMGALVAVKLLEKLTGQLRSIVFLNPILSLKQHLQQEKENKFFYKKLTRELEFAYQKDLDQLEKELVSIEKICPFDYGIPIKMIYVLSDTRSFSQSNLYQKLVKNEINTSYILLEKKQQLGAMIVNFFKNYEQVL